MKYELLGPKDPEEIKVISFPFERELAGATIASIDYVTPTTYRGTDASPVAMKLGVSVTSGTNVLQRIQGGVSGATYKWRAKITDSNGNKHVVTLLVAVKTELE